MKKTIETLATCLAELTDRELKNIKHHLAKGTGIICGDESVEYSNTSGCGCSSMLASTKSVPKKHTADLGANLYNRAVDIYRRLDDFMPGAAFFEALEKSKPDDVREAFRVVLELRGI